MSSTTDTPPAESPRRAVWRRGAFMLFFLVAFSVAQTLLALLAVVQFATLLLTGGPNAVLQDFGRSLAIWLAHVSAFLSAATEDRPFPFAPWPRAE